MTQFYKKVIRLLSEEGIRRFVQKAIGHIAWQIERYIMRPLVNRIFIVENISKVSDGRVFIESSRDIEITYDGQSRSRIPSLLARAEKNANSPSRSVLQFTKARLFSEQSLVNVGWRFFYLEAARNTRVNLSASRLPIHQAIPIRPTADKRLESGFVVGANRRGYAHWLYEHLPKLFWYEKYCIHNSNNTDLVVCGKFPDWKKCSLELAGYDSESYVLYKESEVVDVDHLIVPPHPLRTRGGEFQMCPSALEWLKDKIRSNISPTCKTLPTRVYVSRADANRRQVENEEEVVLLLDKYGFMSIEPGRLPFCEQVRLFSGADIIVGPHGAGLANMIWSDRAKVLELMTEGSGEHFFVLANECNHLYDFLLCEPLHNNAKDRHSDMKVDLNKLEECLRYLIK